MTLLAPVSYQSLCEMTEFAAEYNSPIAIRYPNASENLDILSRFKMYSTHPLCRILTDFDIAEKPEYIFITYGTLLTRVCEAADMLRAEGLNVGVIAVETLKPYSAVAKEIMTLVSSAKRVVYAEEGIKNGGAAEITRDELISLGLDFSSVEYKIAAINDNFASPTSICDLYDFVGLSPERLTDIMKN